jgi:D-beta-D-heptose 7-phosphate kinase/D-beta-D-heptose 1-phosphate adenosyltransferase
MKIERARELVGAFARQRIVVVGDLMLDQYIHGAVERISPEAPVPVVRVQRERQVPGGAANVAGNVCAMGGRSVIAGVVGTDAPGQALTRLMAERGICTDAVRAVSAIRTTVKMRVLADRQQVVRVDWDTEPEFPAGDVQAFCRRVEEEIAISTGVVIEDYSKGIVRQEVVDTVLAAAKRKGIPVGLDPKDNLNLDISGITLATPNYKEAHVCAGLPAKAPPPGDPLRDASLRRAGEALLRLWKPEQLIVTLGPQGMYLVSQQRPPHVIPTRAREVFDVSGAGDTVIATCVMALAAGATYDEAAVLGNNAAGVVVGKLGTATCSPAELLESVAVNEQES